MLLIDVNKQITAIYKFMRCRMKVFAVLHTEIGSYIGHGLTDDTVVTVSIHATKESAEEEAKRLEEENGGEYWVDSEEVKE